MGGSSAPVGAALAKKPDDHERRRREDDGGEGVPFELPHVLQGYREPDHVPAPRHMTLRVKYEHDGVTSGGVRRGATAHHSPSHT
jgi:hypothetical protein